MLTTFSINGSFCVLRIMINSSPANLITAPYKVTNNSISFSFPLYDPDGAVREVQIYLYDGDMLFASIDRGTDYVISDNFTQLNPNTTYRLNIHLGYYLVEGGQHFYLDYNINVTTLS